MFAMAYYNHIALKKLRNKHELLKGAYKRADGSIENLTRRIAWYRGKVSDLNHELHRALDRCDELKAKDQALRLENWHLKNYPGSKKGDIEIGLGDPRIKPPYHEE
jgi:chromosome segregation ATPase